MKWMGWGWREEMQTGGRMEKQEMVMSVAPENRREGTAAGLCPGVCAPQSCLSPIPTPERSGQPRLTPLRGTPAGHPQRSLVLGWLHPEAWPLCPNDAHLFPGIRPFPTLDPNSPSSGMGRGPSRPEGETLLKEAGRGWRGRECPPVEGFSSWRKDRGGGQRQRWPVPSPTPTSSRE